jgi:excisionase family DNA binding protein
MNGHLVDGDWLSLSDVAKMLGVHPSTVRNWSDEGILPVYRTSGGHRRFKRSEIELWAQTARQRKTVEPSHALQAAVSQIRVQIAEGRLEAEPWYQKLDEEARSQYRLSGGMLVRGLMNYLASGGDESSSEAHSLGYEYASRARRYKLSSVEATQAYLFFRNTLFEGIIDAYRGANVLSGAAWGDMLHKMYHFTDEILLSLLKTYGAFEDACK